VTEDRLQRALAGRYEIGEIIGRGGMGSVYAARDPRHSRDVAIKVLDADNAMPDARTRFLREIRVTAGLTHPGIIPVFDSGDAEGLLYYVMPLLRGESLRQRLAHQALSPTEACALIADVADALDLAHRHGVVHRDVKPENILLVEGRPVLTDFGVAYITAAETKTQAGVMVGTLLYMSPEQLSGDSVVDARADVYALGCVLYELLFGSPPHASPTVAQLLARRSTQPVTIPADASAPAAVRVVLQHALEREPERRFATAAAFAAALRLTTLTPVAATPRAGRRWAIGGIVAVAAIAAAALLVPRNPTDAGDSSIAVLPFLNASQDRNLDYVGDGVSDELLSAIADISGVRAVSTTGAEAARGESSDMRSVAERLGVAFVLQGTVRRNQDAIRITARLFDGRTGGVRWTKTFDGTLDGLFQTQERIARAVADELRGRLSIGGEQLVRARTGSAIVHDLVLRARHLKMSDRRADNHRALAVVDSAIALDSLYAAAWTVRARILEDMGVFQDTTAFDALREARDAAVRAVLLDSLSAESQSALGLNLFRYDWDWAAAERHFRRAIQLNPALATAHLNYSRLLRSLGRFDEAREHNQHGAALDRTVSQAMGQGRISYFAHDFERSMREYQSATRVDSSSRTWRLWTAQTLLALERYAAAESLLDRAGQADPTPTQPATRVLLLTRTGRTVQARRLADSLRRAPDVPPDRKAVVLTILGERARALDEVDRAIATHGSFVVDFKVDPLLDPLRNEPRFRAVLKQLRFP
jgi:serine/threonine-protein kinase